MTRIVPIALCALLTLPSCRQIAGYGSATASDAAVPDAPAPDVSRLDASTPDSVAPDTTAEMLAPDLFPPPRLLSCGPSTIVGESPPNSLGEPAMIDDATIIANAWGGMYFEASRSVGSNAFGSWQEVTIPPPPPPHLSWNDLSFFRAYDLRKYVVGSYRATATATIRTMKICALDDAPTCGDLDFYDASQSPITLDVDGPDVVMTDKGFLMAHNVTPADGNGNIYLARPGARNDPTAPWKTQRAWSISEPDRWEDDPTLSPDGLLIVFTIRELNEAAGYPGEFYYATRDVLDQPFSAPQKLKVPPAEPYDARSRSDPALHRRTHDNVLELYFRATVDDQNLIYRSICTLN